MSCGPVAGIETELKLRVPAAQWPRLLASPLLGAFAAEKELQDTYYDTPSRLLRRQGMAYRVRHEDRRWVQTLRGEARLSSGLHRRVETGSPLADGQPRPQGLPATAERAGLNAALGDEGLAPVMLLRVRRILRRAAPARGIHIEIACDRGSIRAGVRRERVSELELQLKSGPVEALFNLAARLVAAYGLSLEHRSRVERGYDLADAVVVRPVKAGAPPVTAAMDGQALCRAVIASTLAQVHTNGVGVLQHDDPECLHQLRIGLRRLRCALDLFAPLPGIALERESAVLRGVASGLGAARDWDVLVGDILPRVFRSANRRPHGERLIAACKGARASAWRKTNKLIKSTSYNLTAIALGRYLADPQPGLMPEQGARDIAARILAACHARVLRRGRKLRTLDDADLHRLRIAVKKLRYALEFFSPLFPPQPIEAQRRSLSGLQDILGEISDAAQILPQLEHAHRFCRSRGLRWPRAAARAVLDWQQARAQSQRGKLAAAWHQFRQAPQPWRRAGAGGHPSP